MIVGEDEFDTIFYGELYTDVVNNKIYGKRLYQHYIDYGYSEGRYYSISNFYDRNPDFDIQDYKSTNDLIDTSDNLVIKHFIFYEYKIDMEKELNQQNISTKSEKEIKILPDKLEIPKGKKEDMNQKSIALIIHIGNYDIFLDDIIYFTEIINSKYIVDLYITIIPSVVVTDDEIIKNISDNCFIKIIRVPNVGFDIGGFFYSLKEIKDTGKIYDFVIKIHTKSSKEWRRQLLAPFRDVCETVSIFEKNVNVGMIGCKERLYNIIRSWDHYNLYHINHILDNFNYPDFDPKSLFVGGTIFMIRFSILQDILNKNIENLISELNDEYSLDKNWYILANNLDISHEEAEEHWNTHGKYENMSPNVIHKGLYPNTSSKNHRDGMIEHAYERFFGIIIEHKGYKIYPIRSYSYIDKHDIKIIPIVFPQFHSIPENDEFWGKGFTEWTLLKKAPDIFEGSEIKRPHTDIGYYNFLDIEYRMYMNETADKYHISGFCFYHYWFGGNKVMYKPTELMLLDGNPDKPFFFSWANESWTNRWDGGNGSTLIKQTYDNHHDNVKHFYYLLTFFEHTNYMKIDNKPLFAFYRIDPEDKTFIENIMSIWNDLALNHGFDGIFFIKTYGGFKLSNNCDLNDIPGSIEFQPAYSARQKNLLIKNGNSKVLEFDSQQSYEILTTHKRNTTYQFRGTFTSWNNTPRRNYTNGNYRDCPHIFINNNPTLFEKSLISLIRKIIKDPNPSNNLIIINAWNEWNEQAMLEPNNIDGYLYLEIVKCVWEYFN